MATKYEYFSSGDNAQYGPWGVNWYAQTFTLGSVGANTSHTAYSAKLKLAKVGAPTGNLTAAIRNTTSDLPSGSNLCSGTLDVTTLTTTPTWYEITLGAGTPLLASTKYAIVVSCPTADGSNAPLWRQKNTGGYAGGSMVSSADSGGTWAASTGQDFMFEEWGTSPVGGTDAPTVTTQACTLTTHQASRGHGTITDLGSTSVTAHGHCWATSASPTTADDSVDNGAAPNLGQFETIITGLIPGTLYYVRAYATNSWGTSYGDDVEITTGSTVKRRHLWVEGEYIHYFSEGSGAERRMLGAGTSTEENPYEY